MAKQKLLLLHGALGAASQFNRMSEILQEDFEIYTMNFPGHGGREIPEAAFSFQLFVDDLIRFLDENKIERINIFGYSMGGYAALWLAKNHPERVNRIFTLATKMDWNEATALREAGMLDPEKMLEKIPAFTKALEQRHSPQDWKKVVRKTAGMMIDLGTNHLTDEDFKLIKHKALISVGDKDTMVSVEESRHVAGQLTNGELHIFPETLHPFEKVNIEVLTEQLRIFLK